MSKEYVRDLGLWKAKGRPSIGAAIPYRPTNPVASNITTTTFTLTWQAAQTPDPAKPVTAYKVYRTDSAGTTITTLGNVLTTNITGLVSGSIYTYQVSAVNSDGESLKSYAITVKMSGSTPPGGTPGAPTIITGSQMLTSSSAIIKWSAPTTGGAPTGYKVFRGGTLLVSTVLASNVFEFTENGLPTDGRTFNYTVKATNASGDGPASTNLALTWNDQLSPDPLFAGHEPYTVMWGCAAPESGNNFRPLWNANPAGVANSFGSVIDILGIENIKVHRYFTGTWVNINTLTDWINEADDLGIFGWCSFKASNWAGVAAGNYDADLNNIRTLAKSHKAAGKRPFGLTFDHEPHKNGGGGTTDTEPERWIAMQSYCSDYFSGIKNGVYTAANDVSDILVWTSIANGNWWKTTPSAGDLNMQGRYAPQAFIDKMKANGGIMAVDSYDAMPGGEVADTDANGNTIPKNQRSIQNVNATDYSRTANQRIESKVQAYIDYCRSKKSGAIGFGEIGVTVSTAGDDRAASGTGGATSPGPLTNCWNIIKQNRDIVAVVNYFNSGANSRWDWRLIPNNYPVTGGTNIDLGSYWPGAYSDTGGSPVTEARMNEYIAIAQASQTPPWNTPPA